MPAGGVLVFIFVFAVESGLLAISCWFCSPAMMGFGLTYALFFRKFKGMLINAF